MLLPAACVSAADARVEGTRGRAEAADCGPDAVGGESRPGAIGPGQSSISIRNEPFPYPVPRSASNRNVPRTNRPARLISSIST